MKAQAILKNSKIEGRFILRMPYNAGFLDRIEGMPGRRWNAEKKFWSFESKDYERICQAIRNSYPRSGVEIQHLDGRIENVSSLNEQQEAQQPEKPMSYDEFCKGMLKGIYGDDARGLDEMFAGDMAEMRGE